jgi:hypothetical protein
MNAKSLLLAASVMTLCSLPSHAANGASPSRVTKHAIPKNAATTTVIERCGQVDIARLDTVQLADDATAFAVVETTPRLYPTDANGYAQAVPATPIANTNVAGYSQTLATLPAGTIMPRIPADYVATGEVVEAGIAIDCVPAVRATERMQPLVK